jgi:hypothetical protein
MSDLVFQPQTTDMTCGSWNRHISLLHSSVQAPRRLCGLFGQTRILFFDTDIPVLRATALTPAHWIQGTSGPLLRCRGRERQYHVQGKP